MRTKAAFVASHDNPRRKASLGLTARNAQGSPALFPLLPDGQFKAGRSKAARHVLEPFGAAPGLGYGNASPPAVATSGRDVAAVVPMVRRRAGRRGEDGLVQPGPANCADAREFRCAVGDRREFRCAVGDRTNETSLIGSGAVSDIGTRLGACRSVGFDSTVFWSLDEEEILAAIDHVDCSVAEQAWLLRRGSVRRVRAKRVFCSLSGTLAALPRPMARSAGVSPDSSVKKRNRGRDAPLRTQNKAGLQRSLPPTSQ